MDHASHLSLPAATTQRRPDAAPSTALPAPVLGLGFLAYIVAVMALLSYGENTGADDSRAFVPTLQWTVWKFLASLSTAIFALLMLLGFRLLRNRNQWGLEVANRRTEVYLAVAVVAAACLGVLQALFGEAVDLPVADMAWRTRAVLYVGLVAAVPWLTIVWLAYDTCRALPRVGEDRGDPKAVAQQLRRLAELWRLLLACLGAFATGVVVALVSAGALRAAAVVAHDQCVTAYPPPALPPSGTPCLEVYPASNVLLYGAVFAFLLTVVAAPLGASWRARALEFVDDSYPFPPDGRPTQDWVDGRERLGAILHLDQSLVRNPLTALSIFVPLLTSVLAQFLPQLGGE